MKNDKKEIVIRAVAPLVAFATAITFSSCKPTEAQKTPNTVEQSENTTTPSEDSQTDDTTTPNEDSQTEQPDIPEKQVVKIATPVLTKNGMIYTFERDENAEMYYIEYGSIRNSLSGNTFDASNMPLYADSFKIYATAKADTDEIDYQDSEVVTVKLNYKDLLSEEQIDKFNIETIEKFEIFDSPTYTRLVASGKYINTSTNTERERFSFTDINICKTYGDVLEKIDTAKITSTSGYELSNEAIALYMKGILNKHKETSGGMKFKIFVGDEDFEVLTDSVHGAYFNTPLGTIGIRICALIENSKGEYAHIFAGGKTNVPPEEFVGDYISMGKNVDFMFLDEISMVTMVDSVKDLSVETSSSATASSEQVKTESPVPTEKEYKAFADENRYFPYTYSDGMTINEKY